MARDRMFGSDVPFCDWMRRNKDLPAFSNTCGFVATDVDLFIHRYLSAVDGKGTREIQAMMHLEVKTRGGVPSQSQLDTLYKIDACRRDASVDGQTIRHFGVSIVLLSGLTPDDSQIRWGRFVTVRRVPVYRPITPRQLIQLMRFDIHPDNFDSRPFRRHHCTRTIMQVVRTPLGFECDEAIVKSS